MTEIAIILGDKASLANRLYKAGEEVGRIAKRLADLQNQKSAVELEIEEEMLNIELALVYTGKNERERKLEKDVALRDHAEYQKLAKTMFAIENDIRTIRAELDGAEKTYSSLTAVAELVAAKMKYSHLTTSGGVQ
jgi:predicted  nucleic acid-binding Zn-ribbon protein